MRIVRATGPFVVLLASLACREVPPGEGVPGRAAPAAREAPAPAQPARERPAPREEDGAAREGEPSSDHDTPTHGVGFVVMAADEPEKPCVPVKGLVRLNFDHAPIPNVIREASKWSCRNFAFTNEVARGEISVVSKTPVSTEEAYVQLGAALQANNIGMYRNGRYYNLVRITDAKKTPIPTLIDDEDDTPATQQPVTRVVRLRYADAEPMKKVLSNFLSPAGADIQAIPPDLLIITDIGLNLRRVERLLREIDQPGRDRKRWPERFDGAAAAIVERPPEVPR